MNAHIGDKKPGGAESEELGWGAFRLLKNALGLSPSRPSEHFCTPGITGISNRTFGSQNDRRRGALRFRGVNWSPMPFHTIIRE